KVLTTIKDNDVKYVDFRFTDPLGKWHHISQHIDTVDEEFLTEGVMFDGSSIAGWKAINESDMILKPDPDTAVMDPFAAQPQLIVVCDILEPLTGQNYARDPRSIAQAAEAYVKSSGVADTVYIGPEAEFFVFDDVRYEVSMNRTFFELESDEGPYMSGRKLEQGNHGHRPLVKGGYFPVAPLDGSADLRAEMTTVLTEMGVPMEKHHHEVAPSQHELGLRFDTLTRCADQMQLYKYVVKNVAHSYG